MRGTIVVVAVAAFLTLFTSCSGLDREIDEPFTCNAWDFVYVKTAHGTKVSWGDDFQYSLLIKSGIIGPVYVCQDYSGLEVKLEPRFVLGTRPATIESKWARPYGVTLEEDGIHFIYEEAFDVPLGESVILEIPPGGSQGTTLEDVQQAIRLEPPPD